MQTKVHQVAVGCITEIFEKIDLENYEKITTDRVKEMINESGMDSYFNEEKNDSSIECSITNYSAENDIVKKINITVIYTVGNQQITFPISKIKVKE